MTRTARVNTSYTLVECTKCKLQYVGEAGTELNLRINNHRKDVLQLNAIPVDRHFAQRDPDFNTDPKFIIIEQLQNTKVQLDLTPKCISTSKVSEIEYNQRCI